MIGYHELEGKRVTLAKPLLVLSKEPSAAVEAARQRRTAAAAGGGEASGAEAAGAEDAAGAEASAGADDEEVVVNELGEPLAEVEYQIVAVVREKLLFTTRPRALISAPNKPEPKG